MRQGSGTVAGVFRLDCWRLADAAEPSDNTIMIRAYEEIVDFIAAGTTPETVAHFEPSQVTKDRVADLIHREKTTGLTPEDASELDHYLRMEHMMRLAKARARSHFADD
jgi:hypothetical protein